MPRTFRSPFPETRIPYPTSHCFSNRRPVHAEKHTKSTLPDDPATTGSLIGCSLRTPRALEIPEPKPPQARLKGAGGAGETALRLSIGATALTEQLPVLTANGDHFERMDDVTVVDRASF